MSEDLEEVAVEVILRMGQVSGFLDDHDKRSQLPIACEAAKETLVRGAHRLVSEAAHRPMLITKSADGTPITVTHRHTYQQPGGKSVRTAGRQCKEFLVQNQFMRAHLSDD